SVLRMAPATAGPPPIPFHTALEADWLQARRTAQPSRRRFSELASSYDPQRGAKPRARDPARVAEFERLHAPLAKARVRRLSDWSPEQFFAAIAGLKWVWRVPGVWKNPSEIESRHINKTGYL